MPLLDNKDPLFSRKLLGVRKLLDLQAKRLTKLDQMLHIEDGLTGAVANVNVDWTMLVAVKKEAVAVLLENLGHRRNSYGVETDGEGMADGAGVACGCNSWPLLEKSLSSRRVTFSTR